MSDDLFFKNEGTYSTVIKAQEISNNITEILNTKIKEELEGICVNDGYIKKDSIKIISKSMGKMLVSFFNGMVSYTIKYVADVCNPLEGVIIKATVNNINKMGILAYGGDTIKDSPLNILLAVQHHQDNEYFGKLQEKDIIYVKILGKRFEYGDTQISIIGVLADMPEKVVKENLKKVTQKDTIYYFNHSKNYKWFSNFNIAKPFQYKTRDYPTIEHAFQAQQVENDDYKDLFTIGSETYIGEMPNIAKKTGNKTNIKKMKRKVVEDWNDTKVAILEDIIRHYFNANTDLKQKLVKTDPNELVFKGVGVDTFWGVSKDEEGENHHGKILMTLRDEFKDSQ